MALTAMQSAPAFHFCGGVLVSVGLADAESCCCGKATGEDTECPARGDGIAEPLGSCCSGFVVKLSTDEFRSVPATECGKAPLRVAPVGLWTAGWFGCEVRNGIPPVQHFAPPGAPAAGGADLLALVCTLRI
jgi:hypothetical protein